MNKHQIKQHSQVVIGRAIATFGLILAIGQAIGKRSTKRSGVLLVRSSTIGQQRSEAAIAIGLSDRDRSGGATKATGVFVEAAVRKSREDSEVFAANHISDCT